jgi:hypothetical protein
MPIPSDDDDVSHCIKCLKLVLPAIADGTPERTVPLAISSACSTYSIMNLEDWRHWILIFTRRYDSRYSFGVMADPGALFDYFLRITPEAGKMCDAHFKRTTTFSCACTRFRTRETSVYERGISISLHNDQPPIHHILREFQPENVNGYKCEECLSKSDDGNPATRHRSFLSLPRFLKIATTGPQTSTGLRLAQDYIICSPVQLGP